MKQQAGKRDQTQVRLDPKMHKRAKIEAAKRGVSMKTLLIAALESYLSLRAS